MYSVFVVVFCVSAKLSGTELCRAFEFLSWSFSPARPKCWGWQKKNGCYDEHDPTTPQKYETQSYQNFFVPLSHTLDFDCCIQSEHRLRPVLRAVVAYRANIDFDWCFLPFNYFHPQ